MAELKKTALRAGRTAIVLLLATIMASCASTGEKKKGESLKTAVEEFNRDFRWEDYKEAAKFVPLGKREQFWAEVDKFKGKIRMIEYQIREVQVDETNQTATAVLYVQFWRPDSPTLQTVTFSQGWWFSEKEKLWKVADSGFGAITKTKSGF